MHFPVTTRYWRGVRNLGLLRTPDGLVHNRWLRRACDWRIVGRDRQLSYERPQCDHCRAYRENLERLGYLYAGR